MNLFTLDINPANAATMFNDKHVLKMILETAQILDGGTRPIMQAIKPKGHHQIVGIPASQINNPIIKSAASTIVWDYAHNHFKALLIEYRYRYGKRHSYDTPEMYRKLAERGVAARNSMDASGFYLAMPLEYQTGRSARGATLTNAVASYRAYYASEKTTFGADKKPATWKRRSPPMWLNLSMHVAGQRRNVSEDGRYHFYVGKVPA